MIGDAEQYRELTELYSSYGNDELVALGRTMADLTEAAQEALRGELGRRRLTAETAREEAASPVLSEDDLANLRAYAAMAPAECVFEFEDGYGASAAYLALGEAGIESVVLTQDGAGGGLRGPRVVVAPEDAKRATVILSQPLAERFRTEAEVAPEEFDVPACPICGSRETLLESVDPVNEWRCDDCDHIWLEDAASAED
jgi:hypothetical protein